MPVAHSTGMNGLLGAIAAAALLGATAPSNAAVTVHIKNFAYAPATINVKPGTAVRFVNDDGEAHTVTASDKSFDSTGIDSNESWTYTFAKAGKYAYFCALHPYMRGTVVVTGGAQ